ncbi:MAG: radical SAM protein [Candidatus Bathyarchaeia archaeon]|jgi:TDP-4-amino-4,6-dideoxy-D-glucose deaminase
MKLENIFGDSYYSKKLEESLEELLPSVKSNGLNIQVIKELFLKPYLPSSEICREFDLTKADLRKTYSFIRSSQKAKELSTFTPYPFLITTMERLSKNGERISRIIKGEKPIAPETLELFISQSCNAKCKFCYRNGHSYDQEKNILSTPEYICLINEFSDMNGQNLDVSGGLEPLLSPSLLDVLKTGVKRKLKVSLYTNGIALNSTNVIAQLVKIHKVRVSLNAADRKGYIEIMGVDEFERVTENLKKLVETKRRTKSNVKVGAGFVVVQQNYKSIPEALTLAQELKLDFFDLRAVESKNVEDFNEEQRSELRSILTEVRKKKLLNEYGTLSVSIADTFNEIIFPKRDYMQYIKKDLVNALSFFRITVTHHGRVYALNLIGQPSREDKRFLLGKISLNSDLSSILSNKTDVPYDENSLLAHDITIVVALSKLISDLEFGINLVENPFNWK